VWAGLWYVSCGWINAGCVMECQYVCNGCGFMYGTYAVYKPGLLDVLA
jgi:hypothetical protein